MRATLNLDDDVAARLEELAKARGRSLSREANDLLRAGLRSMQEQPRLEPYDPPVFDTGRALVDVTDVAGVLDMLDRQRTARGNHSTDAHLAALAIEWGLELQIADRDFSRYQGPGTSLAEPARRLMVSGSRTSRH